MTIDVSKMPELPDGWSWYIIRSGPEKVAVQLVRGADGNGYVMESADIDLKPVKSADQLGTEVRIEAHYLWNKVQRDYQRNDEVREWLKAEPWLR